MALSMARRVLWRPTKIGQTISGNSTMSRKGRIGMPASMSVVVVADLPDLATVGRLRLNL